MGRGSESPVGDRRQKRVAEAPAADGDARRKRRKVAAPAQPPAAQAGKEPPRAARPPLSFKGVHRELWSVSWTATVRDSSGSDVVLGQFDTSAMAARAVDLAIVRLRWPERPKRDELNFPLDTYHYDYLKQEAFGSLSWEDFLDAMEAVWQQGEAAVVGLQRSSRFRGVMQSTDASGAGKPVWLARWEETEPLPGAGGKDDGDDGGDGGVDGNGGGGDGAGDGGNGDGGDGNGGQEGAAPATAAGDEASMGQPTRADDDVAMPSAEQGDAEAEAKAEEGSAERVEHE